MRYKHEIYCEGENCKKTTYNTDGDIQMRKDAYGIQTGWYCEDCFENNYPYRKDYYYDYFEAGEYLDDDY